MCTSTERALIARINRRLDERLHLCSYSSRWFNELGRVYSVGGDGFIKAKHVCPREWGWALPPRPLARRAPPKALR